MTRQYLFILILILASISPISASSQEQPITAPSTSEYKTTSEPAAVFEGPSLKKDKNIFNHMSAGISVGSPGIGIDVSTHVTDWIRLRAGADWMPKFAVPFNFSISSYTGGSISGTSIERLQEVMKTVTGITVDDEIKMDGTPNLWNFKFLVDVYPWKADRRWRVTAGFYLGSNKIGKAVNNIDEAPSLIALNIYNNLYNFFASGDYLDYKIPGTNGAGLSPEKADKFLEKGEMGIHVGNYIERDENGNVVPYLMKPGTDGKVQAWALVDRFRPYLGFGFGSPIAKRLNLDVDLGVMFWGGRPTIVTHEGVDLTNQVENIPGRPGEYIDLIKKFTAYPVITVRLSFDCF